MNFEEVAQILKSVLRRPVAYHRAFAELAGKASAGVMLSQAWYWAQRTDNEDGWFYKTVEEWTEETALTRTEQETARKRLTTKGLIDVRLAGVPATLHFRVNTETILRQIAENPQTGKRSAVRGKPANSIAENPQTLYIGSESTKEYTQEAGADWPNGFGEEAKPAAKQASSPTVPSAATINLAALAHVTGAHSAGFSVPASQKIALAARPGAKRRPPKPVGPATFPVPSKFFDSLNAVEKRELSDDLNFDRGELPKRVEAWQIDRQEKRLEFVSRDAMKANLRKYLINCDVNKNQRRAS